MEADVSEFTRALHAVFGKEGEAIAWWQMCLRATLMFLYGVFLLRLAGTRIFGKSVPIDIVMSVIIGSNLSRTLTGNAPLIEVMAATAWLMALHWALVHFAREHRWFSDLVKGQPHTLVKNGEVDWGAMRHEGIGTRDLETAMRDEGVGGIDEIGTATLERDGSISIVPKD